MNLPIRILYAEDNPLDVDLTRSHFEREAPEFCIEVVESGSECLRRLGQESFDLLLLDNHLPDMDGLDVLVRLQVEGRQLPVVLITGAGDDQTVVRALRAGARDYVAKSGTYLESLPGILRSVVARQRSRREVHGDETSSQKLVLYIEPNAMDVELTRRHFELHAPHLNIMAVSDAREALALLRGAHSFDLVLADLRLPGMNGLELIREALHLGLQEPFIMITGKGDEATAAATLKLGAFDYIVKRENYLTQLPHAIDNAVQRFNLDRTSRRLLTELGALNATLEARVATRTAELQAEIEARLIGEARYRTLCENLPDVIARFDLDLRHLYVNPTIEAVTGLPPSAFLGKTHSEVCGGLEAVVAVEAAVRQVFETGEQVRLEFTMAAPTGERVFEALLAPETDASGRVITVLAVEREITERKQAEAAGRRLEEQLQASQKLEALGTLAGGIAHDFNNLLAVILGHMELVQLGLPEDHPTRSNLAQIGRAAARGQDLVKRIMAFSRQQVLGREVIELAPVLSESVQLLRVTLPASVSLELQASGAAPPVLADSTQIQQVVINLCTNAWQALAGRAGHIAVNLTDCTVSEAQAELITGLTPGRHACLEVRDDGPGMEAATLERIFEPFFTTKPVGEGTGLGLTVVFAIVRGHDAAIQVVSTPGEGTCFRIFFPAATAALTATAASEAEAPAAWGTGQHLVYIDDDEALVLLMQGLLTKRGFRVSGFVDAQEALTLIRANPHQVDLVLTDYNMPGLSGLDLARELRTIRADLPVAIASGYITEAMAEEARQVGVTELLFKPNTVQDFGGLVQRLLKPEPLDP